MRAHGEVTNALEVGPWPGVVVALVLLVGLLVARGPSAAVVAAGSVLTGRRTAYVAVVVGLLLALAARAGPPSELDNRVPALLVGLGWPLLLVAPALLVASRRAPAHPVEVPRDVWPAVAAAVAVTGYLALWPDRTRPAILAAALAAYVVVMLAVGLAFGRGAAARTEVLGLLARWVGLGRQLPGWVPPRGAAQVLALVLAGAWCERLRRTVEAPPGGTVLAGSLLVAGLVALLLVHRDAVPALVPLAGGAVVAGGLRRAVISVQLLVERDSVSPDPLGVAGGQAASLAVVIVTGCLAAAVVSRRTGPGLRRLPALAGVSAATLTSTLVVLSH